MPKRDIIVIGASAGGAEAVSALCGQLPVNFPASIFIVWHLGNEGTGVLPFMIMKKSNLMAGNAADNETIIPGRIYVAPPHKHMLIDKDFVRTSDGPKENRFRPAIDPLFRSAALNHGNRVIGVILTGLLDDGVAGLWCVKDKGGIAIVQDPQEAFSSSMPINAIRNVDVDYIAKIDDIASLLIKLTSEDIITDGQNEMDEKLKIEIDMAAARKGDEDMSKIGEVSSFTCPECHGALWKMFAGNIPRFRCRTGHAYSAESLLIDLENSIETFLWNALRGVEENAALLNHIGEHLKSTNESEIAEQYFSKSSDSEKKLVLLRQIVRSHNLLKKQSET